MVMLGNGKDTFWPNCNQGFEPEKNKFSDTGLDLRFSGSKLESKPENPKNLKNQSLIQTQKI